MDTQSTTGKLQGLILAAAALCAVECVAATAEVAPAPPVTSGTATASIQSLGLMGGNLPAFNDWGATHPFVDLMKQARKFGTATAPWDESAVVGSDGWPTGDFGVTLMTAQGTVTGLAGIYKFSFNGKADVAVTASPAKVQNVLYNSVLKKTTGEINFPIGTDQLFLTFKNTNGSVKNLKIVHPGYPLENAPVFRTEFLNHIKRAKILRFMDWTLTNNNTTSNWAGRANPATIHDAHLGVAWEDIIELANQTSTSIWINIPIMADDNYVRSLADLLNTQLKPGIPVYIEYSNEVWNSQFQQFSFNAKTAKSEIIDNPTSPLNFDKTGDTYGFRRTANRLKQISDIFRSIVGNSKMLSIYRPVLAGQIVNPTIMRTGLEMIQAVYGPPNNYFYALAGAPYINMGTQQTTDGLTSTQVLDALEKSAIATPKISSYESNGAVAGWYGLKYMAYEFGTDTFGPGSLASKEAANKNSRMQTICENYITNWYQSGFDALNWYTLGAGRWDTKNGTWSLTYDLTVNTPKIACFDATNAKILPKIAMRHMVPGTWDAREQPDKFAPYKDLYVRYVHQPGLSEFMFYADKAGTYSLTLKGGATNSANGANTVRISVDNTLVSSAFAMKLSTTSAILVQAPISLQLTKGINVLRFSSAQPVDSWYIAEIGIQ